VVEVLFILAVAVVGIVLGVFVGGRRYREEGAEFGPAEIYWLREEAEGRISALSPRVMVLAEKERVVNRLLDGGLDGESRAGIEELLVEAAAQDFWGRFVTASALVEEEPVEAFEELGRLPGVLEETISKLDKAERLCVRRRAV
jgi:hypothetical protein